MPSHHPPPPDRGPGSGSVLVCVYGGWKENNGVDYHTSGGCPRYYQLYGMCTQATDV